MRKTLFILTALGAMGIGALPVFLVNHSFKENKPEWPSQKEAYRAWRATLPKFSNQWKFIYYTGEVHLVTVPKLTTYVFDLSEQPAGYEFVFPDTFKPSKLIVIGNGKIMLK